MNEIKFIAEYIIETIRWKFSKKAQKKKAENVDIKEIVGNQNIAKISYAIAGVLYYEVRTQLGTVYQFPVDMNDKADVGTATFPAEIKCITLMRYVRKAINNELLIKIS